MRFAAAMRGTAAAAASRSTWRWSSESCSYAALFANTTSGRGQRATFPVMCEPGESYRPDSIPIMLVSMPSSPGGSLPTGSATGRAPSARSVAAATRDCCSPIASPS